MWPSQCTRMPAPPVHQLNAQINGLPDKREFYGVRNSHLPRAEKPRYLAMERTAIMQRQLPTEVIGLSNESDGRTVYDVDLSDEDVTRILDKLVANELSVSDSRRRLSRRFIVGTALITGMSRPGFASADIRVRLRNISREGVAFLSRYALEPGTRFRIQLPTGPELSMVEEEAVVIRCQFIEDSIYDIGVQIQGR